MKSGLRKEIKTFLDGDIEGEYDTTYQTNEILKLFKQKIDLVLENDKPNTVYSEFQRGYLTAFRDMQGMIEDKNET